MILAYACFCKACSSVSLKVTFGLVNDMLILQAFFFNKSSLVSTASLVETLSTLTTMCSRFCTNGKPVSTINKSGANASTFNEYLAIYGFECTSIVQESIQDKDKFTFQLKPVKCNAVDNVKQNNKKTNKATSTKPLPSATKGSVSITENTAYLYDDDTIVVFVVGGRIFKVRRTVIEAFPDTMLAQYTSDLWRNMSPKLVDQQNNKQNQRPIIIDHDSHCFSYVLDYMRDKGVVALPITISKEEFKQELQYY
jgi:BTB/POZ domain